MMLMASFLAGSLLSLLLPTLLLIALVVWYLRFFRTVPETAERDNPAASAATADPTAGPELGRTSQHLD